MSFELNKSYPYQEIEKWVEEDEELSLTEYGEETIGENFLVMKNDYSADVISFILDGTRGGEYMYKVIYKD
jgi:hypothetical protein